MDKDMEIDLIYYELKLQSLLEKFLEDKYYIKNDVYFNRLLSFLSGKENKDLAEILLKLPLMAEWIVRATNLWEQSNQGPNSSICAFALHLLALISKDETICRDLLRQDVYNRLIRLLDTPHDGNSRETVLANASPTVKLAFIKLATCVVAHPAGRDWLLQNSYWRDVLRMSLRSQTVYITREGHAFIAAFIDAFILSGNHQFASSVWRETVAPLLVAPRARLRQTNDTLEACDEDIERQLGPTVNLINDVLEYIFDKCLELNRYPDGFPANILTMKEIVDSVQNYLYLVRNQNFSYELGRIWILLSYISMTSKPHNGRLTPDIDKEFMEPIFTLLGLLVDTSKMITITKLLYFLLIHWYKIKSKVVVDYIIESDKKLIFEDQFIIHQLMPSFVLCRATCDLGEPDDMREDYALKLFGKLSKTCIRWGYKWRDCLRPSDALCDLGPKSIAFVLQLKTVVSRDSAVVIFQQLLYSLVDMNRMFRINAEFAAMIARHEAYLKTLLESLTEFIVHFNISWRDSVESLCVFLASVEFLKVSLCPSKLVIADLNLIKVGIKRYLSPDLALLIDRRDNCAIHTLGLLLKGKLHDPDWSVRDSALEVVGVIAEASMIEFPSFQKTLIDHDYCELILVMSTMDGEGFVRASALKCLRHFVEIDAFWNNYLGNRDTLRKIIDVLKYETESIAQCEAVNLLTTICKCRDVDAELLTEIHAATGAAAIDDHHWEVRLNALAFWNDRIDEKLLAQGMVDGVFPACTFSMESRKIVTLNETEIRKRILRALDDLSRIGCLTVLKHAIQDDCDLQVSKKGLEVSKKLVDLIEKYKVSKDETVAPVVSPSNDSCYSSTVPSTPCSSASYRDDVIEGILDDTDYRLLRDIYKPEDDRKPISRNAVASRHIVTTSEFLSFMRTDFRLLVNEKEKWIISLDSLSSLLNDMLESYEPSETNAMDCY